MAMRSDPQALDDVIVVAREQTRITTDARVLAEARDRFTRTAAVVLKGFLAPPLLEWVQAQVRLGDFSTNVHPNSGVEEVMAHRDVVWLMRFLLGARDVLAAVEQITGAPPLSSSIVRVYRFLPNTGHHHDWHDDFSDGRRLGLSVNLSESYFEGGNLQLRRSGSTALLNDIRNTGPGDAVIFGLGDDLEHQVLPVVGAAPRVALAGWFLE